MNDTQAQARPKRPALEEVEAYVRGKGYDDRGSANAFYAYHDARAWRRADGTPVLDWRAEADAWHEMGPHYLEPEHPAPAAAPVRTPVPAAPVPEAPAATAAPLPVGGALPPLEIADVAALAATDPAFHVVRKTGIPPRFARRMPTTRASRAAAGCTSTVRAGSARPRWRAVSPTTTPARASIPASATGRTGPSRRAGPSTASDSSSRRTS